MSGKVSIVEVGPRDGLQNERQSLTLAQKIEFIRLLAQAGHKRIEVGALVNPKIVPQMADTAALLPSLAIPSSVRISVLVPHHQAYEQAMELGIKEIAIFVAASDSFNQKNINATTNEALERFGAFIPAARTHKVSVRGYVSTAWQCPYEGPVKAADVVKLCQQLTDMGVQELSISDTIGVAVPTQVEELTKKLLKKFSTKQLAMHFHDTRGTALANVYAAWQLGIRTFDASAGGLGGCPFAPGASGNLATDDLLYMLEQMKIPTGVDLQKHLTASRYIQGCLDHPLPSRYFCSQNRV